LSAGRVGPCIAGCNEDGRYHAVDKYKTLSCHRESASCVSSVIGYETLQFYSHVHILVQFIGYNLENSYVNKPKMCKVFKMTSARLPLGSACLPRISIVLP